MPAPSVADRRPNRSRFAPAVGVSLLFILWAPFVGQFRDWLKATFPGSFVIIVGGAIGLAVLVALGTALVRIRERRLLRYALVSTGVALFAWYGWTLRTGNAEVDAVERFHFVEYGIVAFLFYRAFLPHGGRAAVVLALLAGFMAGTLDEWMQWLVPTRTGVVEDVYLNLFALVCGILFATGLRGAEGLAVRARPPAWRLVTRLAAVVLLVFAGFYDCARLGHEIRDGEIGRFRSFFTTDALLRLQEARRIAWGRTPPRELKALAIEDYFMTEAGWHVQERNLAYGRGDFSGAWYENRILEKYYDPFLDVISFIGHARHRWLPDQRREVEAKRGGPVDYESPALRSRIAIWPSERQFWIVALAITVGLWVAPWMDRWRTAPGDPEPLA